MASGPISRVFAASPFPRGAVPRRASLPGLHAADRRLHRRRSLLRRLRLLITGLLIRERERNGKISFSRFYARRVRRILPAAAVTLLVTMVAAYMLVSLVDQSSTMDDAASAALSVANIRFAMTTDYFNPVSYSPFLHFWSLGVEEQFYFVCRHCLPSWPGNGRGPAPPWPSRR